MTLANKKTSLPRPQSPTLSDGSHPKRPHLASEEFDPDEKFEKLRRIDSPTESAVSHPIQFSPQHIGMSLSGKGSPKDQPTKRSVSPKAMYPPSIQKFLNGKSTITIEEAIEKLKTPSNKTHKGQLEKMKMLGAFQKKEVASNVAFRKAYSNSPASLSPARSTSPIGSPMVTSPRQDTFQNNDNFEMRVDEGDSGIPGISEGAIGKMNFPQQNVENWLNSMMGPGTGNNIFPQDQNQTGLFNAPFGNQGPSRQMSQGNYQGNNGNQMQGNQRPVNNNNQYNQFNQNPSQLTSQAQAFLKNLQGPSTSMTNYKEEDSRDRTNSFLRSPNESSYRSLADTQLSAIQSMIKATRTISPSEPNRGLMATFQKRNSNPESNMMNNGPMFQQQQPLFDNRVNTFNQNQNTMQGFGGGFNGQMQQQYPQYDNNNNNQQVHGQGMFGMQNQGVQMNQNVYNNDNNLKREYPQQQQQQQQSNGFGGFGNQEMKSGMETYPQEQMEWNAPIQFDQGQDPEGFLMFGKNESEDFDLNIIPSDVNFMPNRHPMEEMMDNDNQLMMPEAAGMDAFFNNPHGMFRYNS